MTDPDRVPMLKGLRDEVRAQRATPRAEADGGPLHRPFDAAELDRLTERAAKELAPATRPSVARARWAWASGAIFATAAAGWLVVRARASHELPVPPEYELVAEGETRDVRSAPPSTSTSTGSLHVARGGAFSLVLRPRTSGQAAIDVRAFLEHGESFEAWSIRPQISRENAVRIDVDAPDVDRLPAGASRIVLFVGAPSALPDDAAHARADWTHPDGVRVLVQSIDVVP
jgi:hypothetical protein